MGAILGVEVPGRAGHSEASEAVKAASVGRKRGA